MDIMITWNFALCNSFEQIGDNNSGKQTFHNFSEHNIALISRSLFFASAKYREGATSPLVIFVWTTNRRSIWPGSCDWCQYEGPVPFDIFDSWQCNQVSYKSKWLLHLSKDGVFLNNYKVNQFNKEMKLNRVNQSN